jgi:hypothetical protein
LNWPPFKPETLVAGGMIALRIRLLSFLLASAVAGVCAPGAYSQAAAAPHTFVTETLAFPASAPLGGNAEVVTLAYATRRRRITGSC